MGRNRTNYGDKLTTGEFYSTARGGINLGRGVCIEIPLDGGLLQQVIAYNASGVVFCFRPKGFSVRGQNLEVEGIERISHSRFDSKLVGKILQKRGM